MPLNDENGNRLMFELQKVHAQQLGEVDDKFIQSREVIQYVLDESYDGASFSSSTSSVGTVQEDDFSDSDDFNNNYNTVGIGTFTPSANGLSTSGGVGNYATYVEYDNPNSDHSATSLEKWKMSTVITTGTIGVGNFGLSLGIKSTNTEDARDVAVRLAMDAVAFAGKLQFFKVNNGSESALSISDTAFNIQDNTDYFFELERDGQSLIASVYEANLTAGEYVKGALLKQETEVFQLKTVANTTAMHNTGRFAIFQNGGNQLVRKLEITSGEPIGVTNLAIGDSNIAGLWARNISQRYFNLVNNSIGQSFAVSAGVADLTQSAIDKIDEIKKYGAKNIYINLGSNDVAFGISQAVWEANLNTLISELSANANIILGTPIARNAANLTALVAFIKSKASDPNVAAIADLHEVTNVDADDNLFADYNSGDNIHMNYEGNRACAQELLNAYNFI